MEKVKVVFFIYRLGGGGAARTILNIINHLDREKFEPILVTLNFTYDYERFVRDDISFIKLRKRRLRSAILLLASLLRKERPEILFSTVSTYNIIAILAKLISLTNTKVIIREAALLGGTKKENFKLRIYGLIYRFANGVIALSEGVKQNLIDVYHVKPQKIRVIYNPVDLLHIERQMTDEIPPIIKNIKKKNQKVIVTAGRLVDEKDHLTLIRSFSMVCKNIKVDLIILGEGELKEKLQEKVNQLQLDEKVHFLGFQKNPYPFIKNADIFVLSSLSEGFGHVLVEAMACGTPIVSTDCKPGSTEVLDDGKYGLICKVGNPKDMSDKILSVLKLPEEKKNNMVDKGLIRAQFYDARDIVNQYENVFLSVLNNS